MLPAWTGSVYNHWIESTRSFVNTRENMQNFYRPLGFIALGLVCLACAAGPAPERAPKDIHQGVRQFNKSTSYYAKGCYPKALQHIQEAYERFSAVDQLQGSADCLNTMANIYYRLGEFQSALVFFDETIELFEQLNQNAGLVRALANKSATLIAAGRLDDASRVLDRADSLGKKSNIYKSLRLKTRALLLIAHKRHQDAEELLTEALHAAPGSGQSLRADIFYTLGDLKLAMQNPEQAVTQLTKALDIDRRTGAYFNTAMDLAALGTCYENMARYKQAVGFFKRSLKIFALLEAHAKVQSVLPHLEASAAKAGGNLQATLFWTEQWIAGRQEAGLCR